MNIVMYPFHDYKKWQREGFRTRDAHLYQHFVKNSIVNKILIINRPTSLAEILANHQSWKILDAKEVEYSSNFVQLVKINDKTWCLNVFIPDVFKVVRRGKLWFSDALNNKKILNEINFAIEFLGIEDNIFLLQNPLVAFIVNKIKHSKFVFDAIDNWLYHPQMKNKNIIENGYKYIESNADLITTVSYDLTKFFSRNKNVCWIPNGVDVVYFSQAIKSEQTNVIGYVGKIQEKLDFNLVEECLMAFPNYKFVFLGPVYSQKKRIKLLNKKYNNIIFKGDIHFEKLPQEMKNFDITIIPHTINDFTNSMNPLKLYEYLASGKPVVSTKVAGSQSISEYVYLANNTTEFISILRKLMLTINNLSPDNIVNSIPKECEWSNRTASMLQLFSNL